MSMCVYRMRVCLGSPYSLSATQEEKQEKALEPLSLPFSFCLLCGSFLNLFPHKISMLIANGLSCHGLCGPPGPQKGSQNGPKTPNSLLITHPNFAIYIKVYYTILYINIYLVYYFHAVMLNTVHNRKQWPSGS